MKRESRVGTRPPTKRRRKLEQRRKLIAEVVELASQRIVYFSATMAEPSLLSEPPTGRVYAAVRDECVKRRKTPFDADNKLSEPPCRFNEDRLGPFVRRVAEVLAKGPRPLILDVGDHFRYPGFENWDDFIGKLLASDLRNLIAQVSLLVRRG